MNNITFSISAWNDYLYWQKQDKKTLSRINKMITDIGRNSYGGLGKPEPLRGDLSGLWSRRIDEVNRIVYQVNPDGNIEILQCRGHYE